MSKFNTYKVDGIPLSPELSAGHAFFVGNSTANNETVTATDEVTSYGKNPNRPFATVDFATNQCIANRGDTVHILEGHAETLSTTASWSPDVAGVTYTGHGHGDNRPVFTMSDTGAFPIANMRITGANNRISNVIFRGGQASTGSSNIGVLIGANNVTVDNCQFDSPTSAAFFPGYPITIGNSSATTHGLTRPHIDSCLIINNGTSDRGKAGIYVNSSGSTGDWYMITNNTIVGCFTNAGIHSSTDNAIRNEMILNNTICNNSTIAGDIGIRAGATQLANPAETGLIAGNVIATGSTGAALIDFGAHRVAENVSIASTGTLGNTAGTATS